MTKEEIKAQEEELKLQKKALKLQKKSEKQEKRSNRKPGTLKKNYMEAKGKVKLVKDMYKDMNYTIKNGEKPEYDEELFSNEEADFDIKRIKHSGSKITVTVHPQTKDYFVFLMIHELRSASGIASMLVNVLAFALLIISIILGGSGTTLVLIAVVLLTVLLLGPFSTYVRAHNLARKANSKGNSRTYAFSEAGFDISGKEAGYIAYTWENVRRIMENKNCFYFYLEGDEGFVIPVSDLNSGVKKYSQFRELITEKAGHCYKAQKEREN